MKKQLLISLSLLSLVACSDENDDIYGTVNYDEVKAKTFQQIKEDFYKLFHQKIFDLTGEHLKRLSQEEVIKKMENNI